MELDRRFVKSWSRAKLGINGPINERNVCACIGIEVDEPTVGTNFDKLRLFNDGADTPYFTEVSSKIVVVGRIEISSSRENRTLLAAALRRKMI